MYTLCGRDRSENMAKTASAHDPMIRGSHERDDSEGIEKLPAARFPAPSQSPSRRSPAPSPSPARWSPAPLAMRWSLAQTRTVNLGRSPCPASGAASVSVSGSSEMKPCTRRTGEREWRRGEHAGEHARWEPGELAASTIDRERGLASGAVMRAALRAARRAVQRHRCRVLLTKPTGND